MTSDDLQRAKHVARQLHRNFDAAPDDGLADTLAQHVSDDYFWRGMHPFYEQDSVAATVETFWLPLRNSFRSLQRREDIFFAGDNFVDDGASVWAVGMGHFAGLFDNDWLDIPATRKLTYLPYAEFHRVEGSQVAESAFFCDIINIMHQAGYYPLAPQTAAAITKPGPMTHDGILLEPQVPADGRATMDLVNRMIADLSVQNESDNDLCPPDVLERTWHDDMAWYGPAGIGSTYTIPRYQEQHQHPFRTQLRDKIFNGHIARFAEGNYCGFFGWSNLTNTPTGGFLGLPGNDTRADMRVVDIYRRDGDKLAENWVIIDLLHWMSMQGMDVLKDMREKLSS